MTDTPPSESQWQPVGNSSLENLKQELQELRDRTARDFRALSGRLATTVDELDELRVQVRVLRGSAPRAAADVLDASMASSNSTQDAAPRQKPLAVGPSAPSTTNDELKQELRVLSDRVGELTQHVLAALGTARPGEPREAAAPAAELEAAAAPAMASEEGQTEGADTGEADELPVQQVFELVVEDHVPARDDERIRKLEAEVEALRLDVEEQRAQNAAMQEAQAEALRQTAEAQRERELLEAPVAANKARANGATVACDGFYITETGAVCAPRVLDDTVHYVYSSYPHSMVLSWPTAETLQIVAFKLRSTLTFTYSLDYLDEDGVWHELCRGREGQSWQHHHFPSATAVRAFRWTGSRSDGDVLCMDDIKAM